MTERDAETALEGPFNGAESEYFHVTLSEQVAGDLPTRIFLKEGPASL